MQMETEISVLVKADYETLQKELKENKKTNEIKCLKTQHKCNTYCIKCYESTGKRWMKQTTEVHQ